VFLAWEIHEKFDTLYTLLTGEKSNIELDAVPLRQILIKCSKN